MKFSLTQRLSRRRSHIRNYYYFFCLMCRFISLLAFLCGADSTLSFPFPELKQTNTSGIQSVHLLRSEKKTVSEPVVKQQRRTKKINLRRVVSRVNALVLFSDRKLTQQLSFIISRDEVASTTNTDAAVESQDSTKATNNNSKMVKTFQQYLPETNRTYSCVHCRAHLASHDELISKSFQGSQGRAYLFNSV